MKKLILICTVLIGSTAIAQNILPNSGSVGIGTTSPEQKLQVKGNIKADSCVIVGDSLIVEKDARVAKDMKIEGSLFVGQDIATGNDITVGQNATIGKDATITKNASVGKNLTVDKKIIAPNLPEADNFGNKVFVVKGINGTLKTIPINAVVEEIYNPLLCPEDLNGNTIPPIWSNAPEVIYTGTRPCTGYPKVGIGLDNPEARLGIHVNSTKINDALNIKRFDANSSTFKTAFNVSSKGELRLHTNSADVAQPLMLIDENDKKVFQVSSTGYLRTRRIRVDTETWPDYVFDKNYRLRTLEETEKFILKNGHLPNVPKASEVEEEGQDLGEMNKVLMEKVEELTLYLIEQNKRIKALEFKLLSDELENLNQTKK